MPNQTNDTYTKKRALDVLQERMQGLDWENLADQKEMRNIFREVLAKTSVQTDGNKTVLYAGYIDQYSTSKIAIKIKDDPNARILNKTDAFDMLDPDSSEEEFQNILARSLGYKDYQSLQKGIDELKAKGTYYESLPSTFQFDGEKGLWAIISRHFARETTGEVRVMTLAPRPGAILLQTEIPTLLKGIKERSGATMVNGISADALRDIYNSHADSERREEELQHLALLSGVKHSRLTTPTEKDFDNFLHMDITAENYGKLVQGYGRDIPEEVLYNRHQFDKGKGEFGTNHYDFADSTLRLLRKAGVMPARPGRRGWTGRWIWTAKRCKAARRSRRCLPPFSVRTAMVLRRKCAGRQGWQTRFPPVCTARRSRRVCGSSRILLMLRGSRRCLIIWVGRSSARMAVPRRFPPLWRRRRSCYATARWRWMSWCSRRRGIWLTAMPCDIWHP